MCARSWNLIPRVGSGSVFALLYFERVDEVLTCTLQVKERQRNKLKDYMTMAPALGVTHLLAFTLTDVAPSLRIARLPAGPTLSFRVERYSLLKDITRTSRRAKSMGTVEYLSPPLVHTSEHRDHQSLVLK